MEMEIIDIETVRYGVDVGGWELGVLEENRLDLNVKKVSRRKG